MTQRSGPTGWLASPSRPSLALVHHGHQHLITDGYDNREGLSEVLESFAAVLALHLRYAVPLNLHLSGTLIEAVAWHAPDFFSWVDGLRQEGLVEIIGSAYSQPVLTLFGPEHNRRQVAESLELVHRHLAAEPAQLRGFWVPERVWDTGRLAGLVRDPTLANGGYDWVLLDDRLVYSSVGGLESERARFDRTTAPGRSDTAEPPTTWGGHDHLHPWLIEGGDGLVAVPISADLRYAIPPRDPGAWSLLFMALGAVAEAGPGALAVYADDLEKSAAVGAWTSGRWRRESLDDYEGLLRWLASTDDVEVVLVSSWLEDHPPTGTRRFEPGMFYELAAGGAQENYQGWWGAPTYAPLRRHLEGIEATLSSPPSGNGSAPVAPGTREPGGLWDLAWKQLMAATFETAWHGIGFAPDEVAPWARATASHVRSALVTLAAARWPRRDGDLRVWTSDLDEDGELEVVLANERLFAVVSPRYGGRLVALFDLEPVGGRQVVGNPADDWNWQEELNRYMEVPRNHPGAFADVGHENERWELVATAQAPDGVEAVLANVDEGSVLCGSTKRFRLDRGAAGLEVAYQVSSMSERFAVDLGLSPDYLHLLRHGCGAAQPVGTGRIRGASGGSVTAWVELPPGEPLVWEPSAGPRTGHVLCLRAAAYRPSFRLRLGVGALPGAEIDLRDPGARPVSEATRGGAT